MQRDEIEYIANRCRSRLESLGVRLKVVSDLRQMTELFAELGKSKVSPPSDPNRLLLTQGNFFAVFGFSVKDNHVVLGFAVRLDDLRGEDAQSFLPRSIETIFGVKVTGCKEPLYAGRCWGRAAYVGDLITASRDEKEKHLGPERSLILKLAMTFGHHVASSSYGTDIAYCFLRKRDVSKAVVYGFYELEPYVWATDRDLYPDGSPVWVGLLGRAKLPSVMFFASEYLVPGVSAELRAEDEKPQLSVIQRNATGAF